MPLETFDSNVVKEAFVFSPDNSTRSERERLAFSFQACEIGVYPCFNSSDCPMADSNDITMCVCVNRSTEQQCEKGESGSAPFMGDID